MMHHLYGPGMGFLGQGNFWWMGLISMIIHLLFWIAVIYLAVKLFNKYSHRVYHQKAKDDTAMSILRQRYAKGEIDSEEFTQRKTLLEHNDDRYDK